MQRHSPFANIRPEVIAARDSVVRTRRDLHQHPELGWEEHRTQGVILDRLHSLGIEDVRAVAKTGATAIVEGSRKGPCVLWRADIDALPIPEKTGLPFASKTDGVMHACGHDAHAAIALGLAELVSARKESLRGAVRFVFQPAEEGSGGAQACIADGVLDSPRVDRVLGLHISADVPLGAVNAAPGPFFASPTPFTITITGRGGHAAAPHQSIDSVVVAAHVITALQTVVSRSVGPAETAVLTIGKLSAGVRGNVIAESATMTGTIRTYNDRVRQTVVQRANEVIAGVCAAFGASYEFNHRTTCPPVVNDAEVTAMVVAVAEEFFGPERIHGASSMGADDMALFLRERPGCYFWLGARNEARGIAGRHHDPGFMVDEDAFELGLEFGLRLIERALAT